MKTADQIGMPLKPCPFCNSPAYYLEDGDHHGDYFNFGCSKEGCILHLAFYTEPVEGKAIAIEKWNTRNIDPDTVTVKREDLEKVRFALDVATDNASFMTKHINGEEFKESFEILDRALKGE